MTTPMDPERYHAKNHSDGAVPFGDCFRCQRARAICRSKLRFATWEEAEARAREINEGAAYARPMARYRCRWCPGWHLTTARTKVRVKRAEKQRRKWLLEGGKDTRGSVVRLSEFRKWDRGEVGDVN